MKKFRFLAFTIWLLLNLTIGLLFSINLIDLKKVNAQDEYTLTVNVSPVASGTVTKTPDQATYNYDDDVTLTPSAADGYVFDSWSGPGVPGTGDDWVVTITDNTTVTATFTEIAIYNLTITVTGSGSTAPSEGIHSYDEGTEVEVTATPDAGWKFDHWILDSENIGGGSSYTVTMDANHTLIAVFTSPKKPKLTINIVGNGDVTLDPPGGVYDEGTEVEVTATPDDGWEFDHWILDGDDAGPINPYTITMYDDHVLTAIFIDTTPPKIRIYSPEETATYSTTSIEFNFTIDEEPFWIGYSLDGSDNETIYGNMTLTGLSDGSHTVTVYANDTSGNMGQSNVVNFSVDTTPPIISLTSPEERTYFTPNVLLEFTIINDEATWIGYSLDGEDNETIDGNSVLSGLSQGSHSVVVFANDTAGNTGASDTIQFTIYIPPVDTTPPTITITSPQETNYSTTEVALNFTIDEAVFWIAYSLDDEDNFTISGNSTLSDLSEGEHTIKVFARDNSGNTGASNTVTFKVDTTAPTINLTSPDETTYSTASVFLEFTINEDTTWIGYSLDGEDNITITVDSMLSGLSEDSHSIIVFATDYAGNTGASDIIQFTISIPPVDTTPPMIKINSPQNSTYPPPTVDLNFNINEQASWIAYSLDGSDNVTIQGNTTIPELSEGSHNIVVFATDTADNTGASSVIEFTIAIPPVDTTPPIIVITSPENTTISVSTVVLDFAIDEEVTWIGYSLDGQDNVTITGDTVLSGLIEGSHKITVFAIDTAANTGASDTIQFTISIPQADTTPPTITINSPQNTTYEASEIPLNFSVNEDTSWIGFSLDGQNNITVSEDILLSGLAEGSHNVVVYANDTAGNTGASDIVQFVVSITSEDTTPPQIIINSPEKTTYNTDKITLTFSVNEEPSLKYYSLDGKANITVVDSTVLSDLSAGEHRLIMYAEDSTGNIGASEVITFTIVAKSDQGAQLWIVGIIGIVAFTGFIFSAYIAYDLYKSSRS